MWKAWASLKPHGTQLLCSCRPKGNHLECLCTKFKHEFRMNLRRPALQTKWIVDRQHRKMKGRAYEYGWDFESLVAANEMVPMKWCRIHMYRQLMCRFFVHTMYRGTGYYVPALSSCIQSTWCWTRLPNLYRRGRAPQALEKSVLPCVLDLGQILVEFSCAFV